VTCNHTVYRSIQSPLRSLIVEMFCLHHWRAVRSVPGIQSKDPKPWHSRYPLSMPQELAGSSLPIEAYLTLSFLFCIIKPGLQTWKPWTFALVFCQCSPQQHMPAGQPTCSHLWLYTKHEDANSNCPYPLGATSKCKLQDQIELSVIKLELEEHFIVHDSEALKVVRTMPTAFNSHIQLQADIIKEIPI